MQVVRAHPPTVKETSLSTVESASCPRSTENVEDKLQVYDGYHEHTEAKQGMMQYTLEKACVKNHVAMNEDNDLQA